MPRAVGVRQQRSGDSVDTQCHRLTGFLFEVSAESGMLKYPGMSYNPDNNNQACFMEPEPALAEALKRAKGVANEMGYSVPYGWPVVWGRDFAW